MNSQYLYLSHDPNGIPRIAFRDSFGHQWFVNPLCLYKSLFFKDLKDNFVDQVIMLDDKGCLTSDVNVYIADDDERNIYWLYYAAPIVWFEDEQFGDGAMPANPYFKNVHEVLTDYYKLVLEGNNDKLSSDGFQTIYSQSHLLELYGANPWLLYYNDPKYQHEYFRDCLKNVETFNMHILNNEITWTLGGNNSGKRSVKSQIAPIDNISIVRLRRQLEDYCLFGQCTLEFSEKMANDSWAAKVVLNNVKDSNLSRLGNITEVIISPEGYPSKYPVLYGFCDTQQIVKEIYQTILKDLLSFASYNLFKSSSVEDFLVGKEITGAGDSIRVNHICMIAPDYMEHWIDEEGITQFVEDDIFEITDDPKGYNVKYNAVAPTFLQWHKDYEDATDFVGTKTVDTFDYAAWNRRGLALARTIRNQLPDEVDVWYMYPFEDKSHNCDRILVLKSSKRHLIAETRQVVSEADPANMDKWMGIVNSFVEQAPNDSIFNEYTEVDFMDGDLDILWFTPDLDCRASLNLEEFTFHIWAGANHGRQDDECLFHSVGGESIVKNSDGKYDFAQVFFDHLSIAKSKIHPD